MSTVRPSLKGFAYCNLPSDHFVASTGFVVLRASDGNDPHFILYALLSDPVTRQIESRVTGSNYPAIASSEVKRLLLPAWPPLEQAKIAKALTAVDEAIEQTQALIAKWQRMKTGLMHDLFTRGLTTEGHLRPVRESEPTPCGPIPARWHLGSLLELTDPSRQPILTGPFGADLGEGDFVDDGVPVLRIGNVQHAHLDLSDLLFVSEHKARQLVRYRIRNGDLLFARQGATTGRNALATTTVDGYLINYHIIRIALDPSLCAPIFVEAAFASDVVVRQIERDKGRGTREGINSAQLRALKIPIAPLGEQRAIAGILGSITKHSAELNGQVEKLRQLKQGLMHDLLTGRVRVKVDEAAEGAA